MKPRHFLAGLAFVSTSTVIFAFGFWSGASVARFQDETVIMDAFSLNERIPVVDAVWQVAHLVQTCEQLVSNGRSAIQ